MSNMIDTKNLFTARTVGESLIGASPGSKGSTTWERIKDPMQIYHAKTVEGGPDPLGKVKAQKAASIAASNAAAAAGAGAEASAVADVSAAEEERRRRAGIGAGSQTILGQAEGLGGS